MESHCCKETRSQARSNADHTTLCHHNLSTTQYSKCDVMLCYVMLCYVMLCYSPSAAPAHALVAWCAPALPVPLPSPPLIQQI